MRITSVSLKREFCKEIQWQELKQQNCWPHEQAQPWDVCVSGVREEKTYWASDEHSLFPPSSQLQPLCREGELSRVDRWVGGALHMQDTFSSGLVWAVLGSWIAIKVLCLKSSVFTSRIYVYWNDSLSWRTLDLESESESMILAGDIICKYILHASAGSLCAIASVVHEHL